MVGLDRAGADLTVDSFVKGLEAVKGYRDIFNGPEVSFGLQQAPGRQLLVPRRRQGRPLGPRHRAADVLSRRQPGPSSDGPGPLSPVGIP